MKVVVGGRVVSCDSVQTEVEALVKEIDPSLIKLDEAKYRKAVMKVSREKGTDLHVKIMKVLKVSVPVVFLLAGSPEMALASTKAFRLASASTGDGGTGGVGNGGSEPLSVGDTLRQSWEPLKDVAVALAEPILWMYAVTGCVLVATKNKETGIKRVKEVGYAYILMTMLPVLFKFFRYIAGLLQGALDVTI